MAPRPVTIYVTSLTSQPKVRQHTDLLHRSLKGLEIPYEAFDLVMDQEAKTRWQRAKPPGQVIGLPGYLVGGEWVGTMDDFEYAVESQTLPQFLKQDEDISSSSDTNTSSGPSGATIGEMELERLMREMSDADLDALAGQLGVEAGGVGLMVPEGAEPVSKVQVDAEAEAAGSNSRGLEAVGIKGTGEVIENPDLELEKKMASVEIGGSTQEEKDKGKGLAVGVVETLEKVEATIVGGVDGEEKKESAAVVPEGKEKVD